MDTQPHQIRVEDTNTEALISKISAVNRGYFKDDFAEQFVKAISTRKDVIIHRGYWLRHHIFSRIVKAFANAGNSKKQIISLGAGYDTMPFQILQEITKNNIYYVEIDLPSVVQQKVKKIDKSSSIQKLVQIQPSSIDWDNYEIRTEHYALFGLDLRKTEELKNKLQSFNIDFKIPTLVFAECVLTYIDSQSTTNLLQSISQWFQNLAFLNYEMFNGNDQFGKMMVKNFESRGCPLLGIESFPSMQAHVERLKSVGFFENEIFDMKSLYHQGTEQSERQRIEKIELLDEWEEWNIMQTHYFISLSFNFKIESEEQKQLIEHVRLKIN